MKNIAIFVLMGVLAGCSKQATPTAASGTSPNPGTQPSVDTRDSQPSETNKGKSQPRLNDIPN